MSASSHSGSIDSATALMKKMKSTGARLSPCFTPTVEGMVNPYSDPCVFVFCVTFYLTAVCDVCDKSNSLKKLKKSISQCD